MPSDPPTQPAFTPADARRLARDHYGLAARATPLPGYLDQNFLLRMEEGVAYVLKIVHAGEDPAVLALQQAALAHLARHPLPLRIPQVCPTRAGAPFTHTPAPGGQRHLIWVVTFLPGTFLADRPHPPPALLRHLGQALGHLDAALASFTHPAMHRSLPWDLQRYTHLPALVEHLDTPEERALVETWLRRFEAHTAPLLPRLRRSVIHNDANDHNVLTGHGPSGEPVVTGLIDFGDLVHTYTVAEVAIAATYAMLGKPDLLAAAAHVVHGYHAAYPLQDAELRALFGLMGMRLCTSVCMSARQRRRNPDNAYLRISERPAWDALHRLTALSFDEAEDAFRRACARS